MFKKPTDIASNLAPLLLKPQDAARVLAISPRKLWELTNVGEISCLRIGRAVRYAYEDLKKYVEENTSAAAQEKGQAER